MSKLKLKSMKVIFGKQIPNYKRFSQQQNKIFIFYQPPMKKATVLGLSSNQRLIVHFDNGQSFLQTRFQGFDLSITDPKSRIYVDELIGKNIECSFNKSDNTIRYQNQSLFKDLLEKGVLIVIPKELEDCKLYSSQQKNNFIQHISNANLNHSESNSPVLLNEKQNSTLLSSFIKNKTPIKGKIQYLSDDILIRFQHEGKTYFLQCRIQNCKHYFQLFSQTTFWRSKFLPCEVQLKILGHKYDILRKQSIIEISLPQNILSKFIQQGWVRLNPKNLYKNSKQSLKKLLSLEIQSSKSGKGIHSNKSQILNFIYTKNNYVGIVTNIIEGYVYEITSLKTQQITKIQLPMVICPVGEDTGAFDCRQFARKQLIGKEVNVYLQKEEGLNTTGNIIRIQDWKDIESVLLESGYAHVRDQLKNSLMGQKLCLVENKARENRKGLHKKDMGSKRFEDLCIPPINKSHFQSYVNRRYQILRKLSQKQEVVIEQIYNSLSYKIRIESMDVLINFRLQGILKPNLNPNLKEYQQIKNQTKKILKFNFYQRTMIAFISDYDEDTNQFIGTLKLDKDKQDIQQILIKNSLVYADKYNFVKKYNDVEIEAKKANKLIWQPKLKCFQPGFELDKQKYCFEGKFSWIHNGKIAYVQPKQNFKTIQKIQNSIRETNLPKLHKDKLKIGAWCAAPYDGQLYRAVIKQKKQHLVTVQFFDWGNQQVINVDLLRQLPQQFLYLEKQSIKVSLNLISVTKNKEMIENLRQMLFDGGIYVFKKVRDDSVDFFSGENTSVNEQLILKGMVKADKTEIRECQNAEVLLAVQQELRKQRIGIWQESDSSDEETDHY